MVIGGLWALRLHGLKTRKPNDLDIIVYQPSDEFFEELQKKRGMIPGSIPVDQDGNNWRSYKLQESGLTIDFIMEWKKEMPANLLLVNYRNFFWRVQSVDEVIKAKIDYGREKDLKDLEDFKRDNF